MTPPGQGIGARIWPGLALVIAGTVFADGSVLTAAASAA